MKVTIEIPDTTSLGFLNLAYMDGRGILMLGSFSIDSNDLKSGYVNIIEKVDK